MDKWGEMEEKGDGGIGELFEGEKLEGGELRYERKIEDRRRKSEERLGGENKEG
ncbi:hypothetical protein J9F52_16580 [Bordetella pertussis]|nr:hypothetical protein J9F52_16580 [Bordetella pertussis]